MESHEDHRHARRTASPTLAKSAAVVLAIVALAGAVLLMTGHSLPFQSAHATASGAALPSSDASDPAAATRRFVESRPVDYFPDQYTNGATKIEEPAPTF
jgi:hypothetical protein